MACSNCRRKKKIKVSDKNNNIVAVQQDDDYEVTTEKVKYTPPKRKSYMDYNVNGINYTKTLLRTQYGECTVAAFMAELESFLKAKFRHTGQDKHGVDCIGLVLAVYKSLGLIPKDINPGEYAKHWYLSTDRKYHPAFDEMKERVPMEKITNIDEFEPGDIVVFTFGRAEEAHVGLFTVRKTVIHAVATMTGRVIESEVLNDKMWKDKVSYAYRINRKDLV